jgi:hypothetical protein
MAGLLPEVVRWRGGKADLRAIVPHGLLAFDRARVEQVMREDVDCLEPYVSRAALSAAYDRYVRGGAANDAMTVWRAVTLALWLRRVNPGR